MGFPEFFKAQSLGRKSAPDERSPLLLTLRAGNWTTQEFPCACGKKHRLGHAHFLALAQQRARERAAQDGE